MEPQSDTPTSGLHLPPPASGGGGEYEEIAMQQRSAPPQMLPNAPQKPTNFAVTSPASNVAQPQIQTDQTGDQTDDLDKEWIAKAKLIVEQTKNDPYTQSKEIARVKADYLRIRFNKHIKIGPDKTS